MRSETDRLNTRIERERRARKEAERLLEMKSLELYNANLALKALAANLEAQVKERTKELEIALFNAESATRAKTLFLANMSHEIRTPLNAVLGFSHLLRQDIFDAAHANKLDKIIAAAKHLLGIINDVLDLSKIEADQLELVETAIFIQTSVDNLLSMMDERVTAKGLHLLSLVDPRLMDLPLVGDQLRIDQVLLNFLSNAIKFTDHGAIKLTVSIIKEAMDDVEVHFEVKDNGIGIDLDNQNRIFEAFEQAEATTARMHGGTGLGLTICRKLALMMGGDIGVTSALGQGSTFWFTAKLRRAQERPSLEEETLENTLLRQEAKVLLVEDNKTNQEVALGQLVKWKLNVDVADHGLQAIEMLKTQDYDLILMDMQMLVMGGLEATRCIREMDSGKTVPILAMTANAFTDDRLQCEAAGMNGFITKPVEPERLYKELARWLPITMATDHTQSSTTKASTELLHIDTAKGLRYFAGDWSDYVYMLEQFINQYRQEAENVQILLAAGDHKGMERNAHSIKSIALMLGMQILAEQAQQLESANRDLLSTESLKPIIDEMLNEMALIFDEILDIKKAFETSGQSDR